MVIVWDGRRQQQTNELTRWTDDKNLLPYFNPI